MTVLDLCRVTVQTHRNDGSVAVDLALPTRAELAELLPCVVDIVGGRTVDPTDGITRHWTMSRLDGSVLDDSMTLHENGVRDGEILLLTTARAQITEAAFDDLCHAVITASASADRDDQMTRCMGAAACLCATGLAAIVFVWSGVSPTNHYAIIAAIVAVAATVGSIVAGRVDPEPLPSLTLGITASAFAAVTGFLAVPDGPAPPNLFLAAAVCSAVSIVLLHVTSRGTTCFTAIATFSTMAAIAAAGVALWPGPAEAVGAGLAAASLAMLGVAAKLSIVLAGLSPTMPSATDRPSDDSLPADVRASRAVCGHETLTGLLAGFSASAALGAVLVAAGQRDERALSGVALTAVVSVVLLLRVRQERGIVRSAVIFGGGMVSASVTFVLAVLSAPRYAHWACLIAVVLGVGALCLTNTDFAARLSPVARRSVELLDYLALAAVVPLVCWVGDVFGIIRGLSLT
jgi:type VII secretion integral membrane protein EccD